MTKPIDLRVVILFSAGVLSALASAALLDASAGPKPAQSHFATPKEAVDTLVGALRKDDFAVLEAALGPDGNDILYSGDDVADNDARDRFLAAYDKKAKLVDLGPTKARLDIGADDWSFPIPVVHDAEGWRFDTAAGHDELLNRRIGRNELSVVQVCMAYVDAQREYATFDRDGDKIDEYAQRFVSTPKHRDGLYWESKQNEPESPLGPDFAAAQAKGYHLPKTSDGTPTSYYGYQYKILTKQGAHAAGGAYDYIVKGSMIGGFAMVAYPTTYGNSGVMTFIVNHDGQVFQKDLGPKTASIAGAMTTFDPDDSWAKQDSRVAAQ